LNKIKDDSINAVWLIQPMMDINNIINQAKPFSIPNNIGTKQTHLYQYHMPMFLLNTINNDNSMTFSAPMVDISHEWCCIRGQPCMHRVQAGPIVFYQMLTELANCSHLFILVGSWWGRKDDCIKL